MRTKYSVKSAESRNSTTVSGQGFVAIDLGAIGAGRVPHDTSLSPLRGMVWTLRLCAQSGRDAAARGAGQPPNKSLTTAADGHSQSPRRLSASPPRRRACVRDQSYEDGSFPYRERHTHIAASTRSRVQRRSIEPGWQALQYA